MFGSLEPKGWPHLHPLGTTRGPLRIRSTHALTSHLVGMAIYLNITLCGESFIQIKLGKFFLGFWGSEDERDFHNTQSHWQYWQRWRANNWRRGQDKEEEREWQKWVRKTKKNVCWVKSCSSSENLTNGLSTVFDAAKTKSRISHELPNCNWLEKKIRLLEQARREGRRSVKSFSWLCKCQ